MAAGCVLGLVPQGQCGAAVTGHLDLELLELCLQPCLVLPKVAKFCDQAQRQWLQV